MMERVDLECLDSTVSGSMNANTDDVELHDRDTNQCWSMFMELYECVNMLSTLYSNSKDNDCLQHSNLSQKL